MAPYDIVFSKWTALEPDLLFIRKERSGIVTESNVQGAPDLVIEILSPSNKAYDRKTKLREYEKAGVLEVWYLDPEERTGEILNLGADGLYAVTAGLSGNDSITSRAVPGFSMTLDRIFGA
ncbi:MAG: Uma2 family endonuclease [Acidobacteriota bacterium]|nr:Uma2 family endonuclease [Acidobacteriota bacterium]MDQ5871537.1 Uma2 family endonuclease [Acidobacteriota bacterium]